MTDAFNSVSNAVSRPHQCQNRGWIIFWGRPIAFSDWILRVAEAESGAMHVVRVSSLAEVDLPDGAKSYVFFDDDVAEMILGDKSAGPRPDDGIRWVHGYRNEMLAGRMLSKRREDPGFSDLGLLPMNLPIDSWTPMFRLVLSGDFVVPASLLEKHAHQGHSTAPVSNGKVALTPRESEVLSLVAQGMRNKSIAHELGLSEHTIKLHLHHLISKIGVRNRTQATQWYLTGPGSGAR
jgi:DNA-binding CsgD family transcriptional regulator